MMKPIGHVAGLLVTLCMAALSVGGCTVDGGRPVQGETLGLADSYSPARERVRSGFAEMVLTDQVWPSFDQANANRISRVSDGSPLYAHIRTTRPIGELSVPANPGGRYRFSPHPHLYLHVGDNESLRSLSTCYVTLAPADMRLRELVVPLSPLAYRPGENPTDCWLTVAASADYGRHTYEIRLAGFTGPYNSWLPVADLLAVATVPADFTGGSSRYTAELLTAVTAEPAAASEVNPVSGARLWSVTASPARPAPVAAAVPAPVAAPVAAPAEAPAEASVAAPALAPGRRGAPEQPPVRVVIHHPSGDAAADARARDMQAALATQREFNVEIRSTPLVVASDNLRIFFAADREEAQRTRNLVSLGAVPIRDFSDYRPLPSPGTIEIWLAATQAALPAPDAPQPRSAAPAMQATAPVRAPESRMSVVDTPSRDVEAAAQPPAPSTQVPEPSARSESPTTQATAAMPQATSRRKDAPAQQPPGAGSAIEELRLLLLQPSAPKTGVRK